MKHKKIVRVPATTREVTEKTTCDLCQREIRKDQYDATETHVSLRTGTSYPEGGSGIEVEFDICVDCFKGRLIPWMQVQGAPVEEREWEW